MFSATTRSSAQHVGLFKPRQLDAHAPVNMLETNDEMIKAQTVIADQEELSRSKKFFESAETISETLYSGCTFISNLYYANEILSNDVSTNLSSAWDYTDGSISILCGLLLLLNKTNPHRTQNKMYAGMMIFAGATQCLFTYQSFIQIAELTGNSLAAPIFALNTLFDLAMTGIELYYSAKKTEFMGWLDETCLEILQLDKQLAKADLDAALVEKFSKKRSLLLNQVHIRSKVYLHHANNAEERAQRKQQVDDALEAVLINTKNLSSATCESLILTKATYHDTPVTQQEIIRDKKIQEKLEKQLKETRRACVTKIFSFIGMGLLTLSAFSFPPALMIAGLVITNMIAVYYAYNLYQKVRAHKKTSHAENSHGFFNTANVAKREPAVAPAPESHLRLMMQGA